MTLSTAIYLAAEPEADRAEHSRHHGQRVSLNDVAKQLGIDRGTVKKLHDSAIAKMRKHMERMET